MPGADLVSRSAVEGHLDHYISQRQRDGDVLANFSTNRLGRRSFSAIAAAAMLSRCASVPQIDGLTPREVGLAGRKQPAATAEDSTAALQQQYELQRALSASPIVFGNQVKLLASGADAFKSIFQAIAGARDS